MKLIVILTFTLGLTWSYASVYSQGDKLTVHVKNMTIKDVLKQIEEQSEYSFMYNASKINIYREVDVNIKNSSVNDVLNEIFSGEEVYFKFLDKNILLFSEPDRFTNIKIANQELAVKGKVTDVEGNPLPGVNVVEKGTTNGAVTNIDGAYSISISSPEAILSFSYVGFLTEEINAGGQTTIDMVLVEDIQSLEEVVVIGYGSMKKADLTGSIGSVANEELTIKGTTSVSEALQGQVAGVNINAQGGRAGNNFDIQIRGENSLSGGSPLYVVDGIPVGNIQFLNPQDIEQIDILKDASSTAIYGSRGSNGVIIVTTKQAADIENQKPIMSYNGYYGIRTPARLPDLMDGDQFWKYRNNAYIGNEFKSGNDITDPMYNLDWINSKNGWDNSEFLQDVITNKHYTDWYDTMTKNGSQQNHWLSIAGKSNNKMSYVLGMGYQEENGILANEWSDRYNFKASINHEISDKWTTGANINVVFYESERGEPDNSNVKNAFILPPVIPTSYPEGYENAGELILYPGESLGMAIVDYMNPLITIENLRDNSRGYNILGNVHLQYSPIKDLSFKTIFSPYIDFGKEGIYQGSETSARKLQDPAASLTQYDTQSYVWDNQVIYQKQINDHHFNVMGLYSLTSYRSESSYTSVENLPFESLWNNLGSASDIVEVSSGFSKYTLVSLLGRLNYSYKEKYLLTASFRSDGSSKLATGNKWASFPSFALGWRASEEEFLNNINMLSYLKLRASYGYTGNNNIGPYSTLRYASTQQYYQFGNTIAYGFSPSNIANSELTWEKTREFNFGIDFGFFNNRINGSVDVYDKLSSDLLMGRRLAIETGWNSVVDNIGSVSNKGVEVLLNTVNIKTGDFTWKTTITFAKNKNAIEELYNGKEDDLGNRWFIGEPVDVNYCYVFDGIWQKDEAEKALLYGQTEGQAKVKDLDDNGVIDDNDRTIIGTPNPDWTGSFSTNIKYKGFDFSASLFTQQGAQVYSQFHQKFTNFHERWVNKLDVNYYMPENNYSEARISNEYPMPRNNGAWWGQDGLGYYKDVSFVKVKNISLGYTFKHNLMEKIDIRSLRLYANVLNPFVFTDFDGYDPEWAGRNNHGGGLSTITYQFGINLNF